MQAIPAIISIIGTTIQTVSQVQQANAEAAQDRSLAKQEIGFARTEEDINRRRSAQIIAKQQAGAAAAGLDIGSGTPLALLMDSAFNAEMNALQIRKRGEMSATFYKNRARQVKAQIPGLIFQGVTSAIGKGVSSYFSGGFSGGGGASGGGGSTGGGAAPL